MIVKLNINDYSPILDVEKYGRLFLLREVKKLDFGYSAKMSILKKNFNVLVNVKSDSISIIENDGRFYINVKFNKKGEAEINVNASPVLRLALSAIELKIAKNLEEYAKYICKTVTVVNKSSNNFILELFRTKPVKTIDLRGTVCPVPEIEAKKAIMSSKPYDPIEVLVDHPGAIIYTLPEVAKIFNCRYEVRNMGDYASFIFICGKIESDSLKIDLNDVKNIMRDEKQIAKLYTYFDKIIKQDKVNKITNDLFNVEGLKLIVASPEGRGWLFTGLFKDSKLLSARLESDNVRLFDEEAFYYIMGLEGMINVYYLTHEG
ncbi:SirA family protein [Sulfolobus sp. D5]|nr:SirA family protein [Sulfolobus sp. D5]